MPQTMQYNQILFLLGKISGTNILEVANAGITDEQCSGSGRTSDIRFKNGHEPKYNLGSGQQATPYTAKAMCKSIKKICNGITICQKAAGKYMKLNSTDKFTESHNVS
jgi:hypothetical protein